MRKKYLVAFLVVALFATASVSANSVFKKLTATERPDYKLVVNGDTVALKNNPITIDGVTYLPLREVATVLNQDVGFDSGTIKLNSLNKEGDKVFVAGRPLIEVIGKKYPKMTEENKIWLDNKGVLGIGDIKYQLEINDQKHLNITPLIDAGVVSESDFQ